MADIFCNNCGLVFHSHIVPCPRCLRCSRCGSKCPKGAASCPAFAHPLDAESLAELEQQLDPGLTRNQRAIRSCEKDWANEQLLKRLNVWGHAVLALHGLLCLHVVLWLLWAAIQNLWISVLLATAFAFVSSLGFFRLLRGGWFRVLLRKESGAQGRGSPAFPGEESTLV
jgi:hypothetical protein